MKTNKTQTNKTKLKQVVKHYLPGTLRTPPAALRQKNLKPKNLKPRTLMKTNPLLLLLVSLTLLFTACDRSDAQGEEAEGAAQTQTQADASSEGAATEPALDEGDSGEAGSSANVRTVRTVQAEEGALSTSRSTSVTIEPAQESQVAANVGGQVAQILKREGATVEQGETVVRLDDENLRLQVQNARTAVQSARVNLQTSRTASQENTGQSQSQLQSAQVALRNARQQYESGQQIYERGGISQVELNNLEAQFEQAQTANQQAQDALSTGRSVRPQESLELQQLQLEQAQTQLAQAERALADANIKAPFAGEISEVGTEVGEFLGAGTPAFTVISTDNQLAKFSVPVQDATAALRARAGVYPLRRFGLCGADCAFVAGAGAVALGGHYRAALPFGKRAFQPERRRSLPTGFSWAKASSCPPEPCRQVRGRATFSRLMTASWSGAQVTLSSEAGNEVIVSGDRRGHAPGLPPALGFARRLQGQPVRRRRWVRVMNNLVKLFVERYVASISIFGALMLFGAVSYIGLGIDFFPEIDVPIVAVVTTYPGAGSPRRLSARSASRSREPSPPCQDSTTSPRPAARALAPLLPNLTRASTSTRLPSTCRSGSTR